ncbi:MAG: 30S ribosomal protein S15 [Candidatus Micrarchaeota archaeon]|nr:30S ribosomal protein S15 [Candidatus Micrarchaeota archaeon]
MARMHARKRGTAKSYKKPFRPVPEDLEITPAEVEDLVVSLYRQGNSPSQIGAILRDKHKVPDVKAICGKKIVEILKENQVVMELPEDLLSLIRRAVRMIRHLRSNKRDTYNSVRLTWVESKIRRLVRYYRRTKVLPQNWRYSRETAELIVR